jgi:hypothetical protein
MILLSLKSKPFRDLVMSSEVDYADVKKPMTNRVLVTLCRKASGGFTFQIGGLYMKRIVLVVFLLAVCALTFPITAAAQAKNAFGFNSPNIAGFPTGAVELTGGGAYDLAANFVHSGGGFRCTAPVGQGPLSGCLTGEGVRWDTQFVLPSTNFKCTAAEAAQTATTSDNTAVLLADFYRQGDGNDESFTALMIVSANGLPGHPSQNVWIQGVGCGLAVVNFNTAH